MKVFSGELCNSIASQEEGNARVKCSDRGGFNARESEVKVVGAAADPVGAPEQDARLDGELSSSDEYGGGTKRGRTQGEGGLGGARTHTHTHAHQSSPMTIRVSSSLSQEGNFKRYSVVMN